MVAFSDPYNASNWTIYVYEILFVIYVMKVMRIIKNLWTYNWIYFGNIN